MGDRMDISPQLVGGTDDDANDTSIDVLIVSSSPLWPLDQGFRVHGANMAAAMTRHGARVRIASTQPLPDDAPDTLRKLNIAWPAADDRHVQSLRNAWAGPGRAGRFRLADYQGLDVRKLAGVVALVEQYAPRAIVGVGLDSAMMLRAIASKQGVRRVWYGADEMVRFHLSCLRREPVRAWAARVKALLQHVGLERLFVSGADGAIGVSPMDTRLLRWIAGARSAVTIRNGVDLDYFQPGGAAAIRHSIVFWGRLDFEPNIDAVRSFADNIWPAVRERYPLAIWRIIGKQPGDAVEALNAQAGIDVVGAVDDIRPHVHAAAAVVLPMRCGGGIKNKLLEAAAMGRPTLVSPRALAGLEVRDDRPPFVICRSVGQWVNGLGRIWSSPVVAADFGRRARLWVQRKHSWADAAGKLMDFIEQLEAAPGPAGPVSMSPEVEADRDREIAAAERRRAA